MGSHYFVGTDLVLQDEESSGDWLHNSVHVFNTIVHIKMFKIVAFMLCAFYHN